MSSPEFNGVAPATEVPQVDLSLVAGASPAFRLLRLVLIDSYARNKTVEVNLDGHLTLTGENGGGKTTLLRLLPIFFGESPSRVIQSDDNNHSFGRHYFPTTASYIIYEYERRGTKVLAVIHPDGQSDGVIYRFIDSPYRTDLFRDGAGPIQSRDLTRHLTKLGVSESKPLTLTAYRNILHNTAGRDHRQLASRFAFVGSGGQLTHIERVITAILQRATTFYDLKRMIVSSVQDRQEAFSMRTGKRELLHWIAEFEAHHAVMERVSVMDALERDDALRRAHEQDFARVHASLQVTHDHFQNLVVEGERREKELGEERETKVRRYTALLQSLSDKLVGQNSVLTSAKDTLSGVLRRKKRYEEEDAAGKAMLVDAIPVKVDRRRQLVAQLDALEGSVRSISEIFERMAGDAKAAAVEEVRGHEGRRTKLLQDFAAKSSQIFEQQRSEVNGMRERHRGESEEKTSAVSALMVDEGRLELQAKHPQVDPLLETALTEERERQAAAGVTLENLHDGTAALEKALRRCQAAFEEAEEMLNGSQNAVERIDIEMQGLVDAGNAGENTLIGFLRANKPDWHLNIGRILSEETLLRTDLAPNLSEGADLYGVSIAVDKIAAGRLTSEETIQAELQRLRSLLSKRKDDVEVDKKTLAEKGTARDHAKKGLDGHTVKIVQAKQAKQEADRRVQAAVSRLEASLAASKRVAIAALQECRDKLKLAREGVAEQRRAHAAELKKLEEGHTGSRLSEKQEHDSALQTIATSLKKVEQDLQATLADIATKRDASLAEKGIDVSVLNGLRGQIDVLDGELKTARELATFVHDYRAWLEAAWARKDEYERAVTEAERLVNGSKEENRRLLADREQDLSAQDALIKKASESTDAAEKNRRAAGAHMHSLISWPKDEATLVAGFDPALSVETLSDRRRDLQRSYDDVQRRIREGVDDIRRAMMSTIGTGPERFHSTTLQALGMPTPGKEYLWIEGLRGWFNHEHASNRAGVIQLGKTMALNISAFWSGLGQFKKDVANFASDLRSHLHQGKLFANIADVSAIIGTEVDKQGYWQAIENLHFEYEAWHSLNDNNLPPPSFIDAAREVAAVISDDKGLVADPVDLINLQITATIDGDGGKVAKNEASLARMSSNGLSYVILCFILLGFINRIRRKEPVQIPFVVDELKDLSQANATALLNLLARNNVTLISAFPDVDPDLAPLFTRNYKIQPGRVLATVVLDDEGEEVAHV
jgi:hypothetical protein